MSSWKTYQVKELCSDIIDCVNKTAPISDVPTQYKMLRTSDIRNGVINTENLNCVTEDTFKIWTRRGKLKNGDIIFTREAPLGEVGLVRDAENYFLGQRLMLFRADPLVCDNRFLLYAFQYYENKQAIIAKGVGATVLHLRVPECEKIEIKAPDLSTQQRIADILSAYDDLIENNQKQIKLLEEAAQRLYKEWFVDLRFPGYENVPVVDGVPQGWKKTSLGEICCLRKETVSAEQISSDIPYIGLEHMPRIDFCLSSWGSADDVTSNKFRYTEDDIIFGKIRPYFHKVGFALNSGIVSTDSFVMEAKNGIWGLLLMTVFDKSFVDYTYQTCKEGAKMPRADWTQMKKYSVLIPHERILKMFEEFIWNITRNIKTIAIQNHALTEARDRLLPKLMSGELEV